MEDALWAQLQNTSLEDYDDKDRIEPDSDVEEEKDDLGESEFVLPIDNRKTGPQTGPKGVKADHDYQKQKELVSSQEARADYNARLLAKAPITTTYAEDQQEKELVLEGQQQQSKQLEEDDLKYYREKRLKELKYMANNNHRIRQQQKIFGSLTTVEADDYPNEIDDEWRTIPIIVHLYDESLPLCKEMDNCLYQLSQKYVLAKFIRVSANDLEFDLVGSPALLAYQNGMLIANLVRIIDEIGSRFDIDAIEDILTRYGALSENDLYDIPIKEDVEQED